MSSGKCPLFFYSISLFYDADGSYLGDKMAWYDKEFLCRFNYPHLRNSTRRCHWHKSTYF